MASTISELVILGPTILPDGANAATPNGWAAKATLPYDGAATFDPEKIVLTVQHPGFTSAGAATTRTVAIRGGKILRKQYPNQDDLLAAQVGDNLEVYFSLTDDIYATSRGCVITGAQAEAGYYGDDAVGEISNVVNDSTLAYLKPLFAWINFQGELATGASYAVEGYATHRHAMNGQQVACIHYIAKDAQGSPNTAATQISSQPALTSLSTEGNPFEVYKASIPLTALTQGDLCQVNAKVYPWIGDADSILDLDVSGIAWPTDDPWTKLRFICDKAGTYGGAKVFVKAGVTGGAVSADMATARSTPYPTILAALNALVAWNTSNRSRANHSGSEVFLMDADGSAVEHEPSNNMNNVAAGEGLTRIRQDPNNTAKASMKVDGTGHRSVPANLCWMVDIRSVTGSLDGTAAIRPQFYEKMAWTIINNNNQPGYRQYAFHRDCSDAGTVGGTNSQHMIGQSSLYESEANLTGRVLIGCKFRRKKLFVNTVLPQFEEASIIACNTFLDCNKASAALGGNAGVAALVRGKSLVQNVIERDIGPSEAALTFGGDNSVREAHNVLLHLNTIVGDRLNLAYNDVDAAGKVEKHITSRFNLIDERNTKVDTFIRAPNPVEPGRTGTWRYAFNVANDDVVLAGSSGGGDSPGTGQWIGEYWPKPNYDVGRANVPFLDDRSFHGSNTGMGNYRLAGAGNGANAAYAKVPSGLAACRYDLAGELRLNNGQGASGAFERSDITPGPVDPSDQGDITVTVGDSAPIDHSVNDTSGADNIVYTVHSGALAPGRSLNASTGMETGTYTTAGVYPVVIRGTDPDTSLFVDDSYTTTVEDEVEPGPITYGPLTISVTDALGANASLAPFFITVVP